MIYSISFYSPQLLAGVRRSRAPVSPIHGEAPGDGGFGVARPVAALAAAVAALIVSALARSAGRHPAEITTGDVKVATEPSQGA
jgi:isocitrate/isopropylmalate dehydrogenase